MWLKTSMALSSLGWSVLSYDVNPHAVACSGSYRKNGLIEMLPREGGVGEDDGVGPGWN